MTRKIPFFSAAVLSGLLLLAPASWAKKTEAAAPAALAPYPAPVAPEVAAKAFLLIDISANGQVLASKNADDPVEPASLTKLMTGYLVFDALKNKRLTLEQKLTVSARARAMEGSRMFVDTGWQVPVDDLIKGMITQSGNDATAVLAEGVGGSIENFVQMMNNQAQLLGLHKTHYKNAEGLTVPGHITTASDLALLSRRLMQDFPEYLHYYSIKSYRYAGTPASNSNNRNLLLYRDPSVDGLKTGHTAAAGYCLVATAKREFAGVGQRRLLSVVLGTASENARAAESQKLLNWGYTAFEPVKLFAANQAVAKPQVWRGAANEVSLGLPRDIVVAVPVGTAAQISTTVARPDPIFAPLRQGQNLGTLNISISGRPYTQLPLQTLQAVESAGWFGQTWDAIRLWIK